MKKHWTKLLLSLLFLIAASMSCEETVEVPQNIPCLLTDVELCHWDNRGESPRKSEDNKVPKEAYILELRLLTKVAEEDVESYYNFQYTQHVLSDPITKIQIFTRTAFNQKFPEEADVTSCFSNYPKTIASNQLVDYTASGGTISVVDKTNSFFKALLVVPSAGEYRFRILLTMKSGETLERVSEPILLF